MVNARETYSSNSSQSTGSSTAVAVNRHGDARDLDRLARYTKHWNPDSAKDSEEQQKARLSNYEDVVNGYYDSASMLYLYAWGQSFHFSRYYAGEPFYQAMARHEHYLSATMGLKPGMRVLDVGCGVGGPAREIARFSGADVVGVNNNQYQVDMANAFTRKAKLQNQVEFVKGDFMSLSDHFGKDSFDAVYAIEATVHAPNFEGIYGEIRKVLKPGGVFGVYEWVMTDKYDKTNPAHRKIAHGIELGDGIPEMRKLEDARNALQSVGFEVEHDEDLAERPDEVPWYYPLEGDLRKCQTLFDLLTVFRMTTLGKMITQNSLWVMEKVGLVPKGTYDAGEALKVAAVALVAGGQQKLFTPMQLFVARKPQHTNGH